MWDNDQIIHSLPQMGTMDDVGEKEPDLFLCECGDKCIFYYSKVGLEELYNDCGTLYLHELIDATDGVLKWITKFAKKWGYCVIFGTIVGDPTQDYFQKHIELLKKNRFKKVGQCPSSRHPEKTKIIYTKILQQTVRGYPD